MAWSFNPFTGNLDIVGGGAVVFEGEVETFADLPETIGDPAVGASFLVRSSTGVWLVNRRQAGIWIRRNNTGVRATDWEYGGDYPVNSVNGQTGNVVLGAADVGAAAASHTHTLSAITDAGTAAAVDADQDLNTTSTVTFDVVNVNGELIAPTIKASGQIQIEDNNSNVASLTAGSDILSVSRNYQLPDASGTLALTNDIPNSNFEVKTANYTAAVGDKVAADTTSAAWTLTLPATPSNGDTITVLDYAGTFDTNNLTIARNGSNIESLAENMTCNVEDAAFTLVFVGSTVGWKVVPYFGNKTNFASPDPIGSSVPNTGRFTTLTSNNGALTASAPVLDLAQTWNASGTTFTGLNLALTNTASASASAYLSLSLDGTQTFSIRRGESNTPATLITCGGSGLTWTARTRTGAGVGVNFSGIVGVGTSLQFGTGTGTTGGDITISREAANILAQSNGSNAQTFRIYNTFTDANNHERGFLRWSSSNFEIGSEAAGTGSSREVRIVAGTATYRFATNNAAIFPGTVNIAATGEYQWFNRSIMSSSASGIILLTNSARNDWSRLQFGGDTSSFPALKRSSATLQVRLADDSAYSVIDAQHRLQGTAPASATAAGTAGDIRYDADYIYVCTAANTWKRAAIATW